jgi:biotin transport system substrate-specific component
MLIMPTRASAKAALACLFAALACIGAYISLPLPISPVPLVLSNLFAILGGLLLGPGWGSFSVLLYLVIGALGFPVFSGGRGGLAHLAGPTGGYLVGYLVGALLASLIARKRGLLRSAIGSVLGFASILVIGATALKLFSGLSWGKAIAVGILPFIIGDGIKAALSAIVASKLGAFTDSLVGGSVDRG